MGVSPSALKEFYVTRSGSESSQIPYQQTFPSSARIIDQFSSAVTMIITLLGRIFKRILHVGTKRCLETFFWRKAKLSKKLTCLEIQNETAASEASLRREGQIREELQQTLWQEELMWLQKARANQIVNGDKNTHYFQHVSLTRCRKNRITKLQQEDGTWIKDPKMLKLMAREFYVRLYSDNNMGQQDIPSLFNVLTGAMTSHLAANPPPEETYQIIKDMGGLKAPGKDSFHATFYQKCWDRVRVDFHDHIVDCFRNPERIKRCNETLLVLLSKVDSPKQVAQFRPIGLYNVIYKVLAKCLANRLKIFMPQLINPSQSSFVPKRHI
ncbi:unnamed protein product [Linum trigynum]|uniref:Reverse transcriptase domain-containing protein n=1 Tax=Linum trigynum TaxID=586398 RepID=A0AAV2DFL5_9ROSI